MLSLVLLAAAAASAAPLADGKLPFLPLIIKNGSSFYNEASAAAALDRFHAVVGGPDSLVRHRDFLRSLSTAKSSDLPETSHEFAATEARMKGRVVLDGPSVVEINQPIAQYLYGGDILLSADDLKRMEGELTKSDGVVRTKRGAPLTTPFIRKWPTTQPIAFIFNSDIAESTRQLIRTATQKIAANTCLSFQENSNVGTQLQFYSGVGCRSSLGMYPVKQQPISIDALRGCARITTIQHEILHALGIEHTQSRVDRDDYISVNMGAIPLNAQIDFIKFNATTNNNFGVPYDYGSAMHYGQMEYGKTVIVATQGDYSNTMGQRRHLTFNDYKMVNLMYNCSESCPKQMVCQNGGYPSPKDCNSCVCSDFYIGANCQTPKSTITLTTSTQTVFLQAQDASLEKSDNNNNWDDFGRDAPKIIRAPEGKKIRVTIEQINNNVGQLNCPQRCVDAGVEFVDNANGDLTTGGRILCCTEDEGVTFVSKSNVIGYKAYAAPGKSYNATVSYTVV